MFYVNYYWNLYYVNYINKEYKIVFSYHKKSLKFTKNTREPSFKHHSYINIFLEPPKICLFAETGARLRDKNSRTVTALKNKAPWVGWNIWQIIIQPCVEAFLWINFKRRNHSIITIIAKSDTTRYILIKFQNASYNARNIFVKDVYECSNTFASLCIYIYLTQYNIFDP